MKIMLVHNRYLQAGGEDLAVEAEAALLKERGHDVLRYDSSNESMLQLSGLRQATTSIWNAAARDDLSRRVEAERPDVVHFHNTFPWLSPAVYHLRTSARPRVVQTLHNYRLVCPAATLMRDGAPCEKCVGQPAVAGVWHACYRNSRAATATIALSNALHGVLASWSRHVDAFIALSRFARNIFVRGGLPPEKLYVKPNFLSADPGPGAHDGGFILFAGRLSDEKGIRVLLEAWRQPEMREQLHIVGDGPLRPEVEKAAAGNPRIVHHGRQSRERVIGLMQSARAVVMPSLAQENSPLTLIEAFASGTPLIVSDLGNLRELTNDGGAAVLFRAGDPLALARAVSELDSATADTLAANGRALFEQHYTSEQNYHTLMKLYTSSQAAELAHAH